MRVTTVTNIYHFNRLTFHVLGGGGGYSFEYDPETDHIYFDDGRPFLNNCAWANLNRAIAEYCDGTMNLKHEHWTNTYRESRGKCDNCNEEIFWTAGYDIDCDKCGACYNASGQRLRDDWRDNPSNWDSEIDDMEGYEIEQLRKEIYDG